MSENDQLCRMSPSKKPARIISPISARNISPQPPDGSLVDEVKSQAAEPSKAPTHKRGAKAVTGNEDSDVPLPTNRKRLRKAPVRAPKLSEISPSRTTDPQPPTSAASDKLCAIILPHSSLIEVKCYDWLLCNCRRVHVTACYI